MSAREMRIRVLMSALDGASGPVKKLAQAASTASRAIRDQKAEIKALQKAQANVESFRKVRAEIGASAKAYRDARGHVAKLRAEYSAIEKPTRRQTTALNAAVRASEKAKQTYQLQAGRLKTLRNEFRGAGASVRDLGRYEDQLKGKIAGTTKEIAKQEAALEKLRSHQERAHAARARADTYRTRSGNLARGGAVAVGAGVGIGAGLAAGARNAISFETAMGEVKKVVEATPAQLRALANEATRISEVTPVSREDVALIMAAGAQTGIAREALGEFALDAARVGTALGLTAEEGATAMKVWRTAFGLTRDEALRLADQVNELTNTRGGDPVAVMGMVSRNASIANAAGVSGGQSGAIAASMSVVGVSEEIGGTALKNFILGMTKGEAATLRQREAFASMGLDAGVVAKRMQSDAGGAILDVLGKIEQLPEEVQLMRLDQLFGSESLQAIAPLLGDLDGLRERFELVADQAKVAGSAQREFDNAMELTSNRLAMDRNKASNAGGDGTSGLLADIRGISQFLGEVASGLGKFGAANPNIARLAAILAAILVVGGGLTIAIAGVLGMMATLTVASAVLGVALAPIFLTVLGITAAIAVAVAAGYLLWKNWDKIKAKGGELVAWFKGLPPIFQSIGKAIMEGLAKGMMMMLSPLTAVVELVSKLLPEGVKKTLGIHSPSRVFAKLGGHVMEGLAVGLRAGEQLPLARMQGTAAALTAAAGVGFAGGFGFQATPAVAQPAAAAASGDSYEVHFHPTPGMNERDLFRMFENWMANRDSRGRGSRLRAYTNDSDGD
jgi:TP901 family phage tail tape measure protein